MKRIVPSQFDEGDRVAIVSKDLDFEFYRIGEDVSVKEAQDQIGIAGVVMSIVRVEKS
jgi:hypothetical protein